MRRQCPRQYKELPTQRHYDSKSGGFLCCCTAWQEYKAWEEWFQIRCSSRTILTLKFFAREKSSKSLVLPHGILKVKSSSFKIFYLTCLVWVMRISLFLAFASKYRKWEVHGKLRVRGCVCKSLTDIFHWFWTCIFLHAWHLWYLHAGDGTLRRLMLYSGCHEDFFFFLHVQICF